MSENLRKLSGRKGLEESLFEKIARAKTRDGHTDREALRDVASEYLIGNATVYGTASFYDFLNPEQAGKKAFVCEGTACMLAGTQASLRQQLEQHFHPGQIGHVYCLGRCYEHHAFHYDGLNYSGDAARQLDDIVDRGATPAAAAYATGHLGKALLTAGAPDTAACLAALPRILNTDRDALLAEINTSGLRGRGGAGFPFGIKLGTVRKENARDKYIVCNADEGDPGAFSDRYLLEERPHLVLFGMAVSGYLTGAREGVVYIRAEYPEAIAITEDAIGAFNSLFPFRRDDGEVVDFRLYVIKAQGAYICGEETALLSSIEGLRPEVRTRPPFPAQAGLFGMPTVVSNVETLANVYAILHEGGEAFKALGRGRSTGTKLLSLDGFFNRPGLYEVEMGTPLERVVHELGGGWKTPVKALHIGGPLGGIVPVSKIPELTVDFESFAAGGFLLGHASVLSIPETFPMVRYLEHLFAFTAHESCGKCFPCRIGSVRGKELLRKAQDGNYLIDRNLMQDLLDTMEKGSLCGLGGGIPLPVKNALQYFGQELNPYFTPIANGQLA